MSKSPPLNSSLSSSSSSSPQLSVEEKIPPILFLCSSHMALEIENLYYLKDLGQVLNLGDERLKDDEIREYINKNFIICNMKDEEQVKKLRFINRDHVVSVCVLRKYESVDEAWVTRSKCNHIIKDLSFIKECRKYEELFNFISHLSNFKAPDGDVKYYGKKFLNLLTFCFRSNSD